MGTRIDEDYLTYTYDDPNDFKPPQIKPPDTRTNFQPRLKPQDIRMAKSNQKGEAPNSFYPSRSEMVEISQGLKYPPPMHKII